jgi:hypothetical protein
MPRLHRSTDRSKIKFTGNQFDLSWHVKHDVNHLPQPAVLGIRYRFNLFPTEFKWVVRVPASFKPIKFSSASRTICYNGIYITHRLGTTDYRIFSKQIMLYNSLIVNVHAGLLMAYLYFSASTLMHMFVFSTH